MDKFLAIAITLSIGLVWPAVSQVYNQNNGRTQPYGYTPNSGFDQNNGQHAVQGFSNQQGTYVPPHMQTNPNGTASDNWTTRGNINPYTGRPGTRSPY